MPSCAECCWPYACISRSCSASMTDFMIFRVARR
jgi:hypothetical protein